MNDAAVEDWMGRYREDWQTRDPEAAALLFADEGRCYCFREWWNGRETPVTKCTCSGSTLELSKRKCADESV